MERDITKGDGCTVLICKNIKQQFAIAVIDFGREWDIITAEFGRRREVLSDHEVGECDKPKRQEPKPELRHVFLLHADFFRKCIELLPKPRLYGEIHDAII